MRLGNSFVKCLALCYRNAQLELSGLARTVASRESSRSPGRAAVNLLEVGQLSECGLVSEGDVNKAVVGEGRHGSDRCALLSTTHCTCGNEHAGVLAPEGALLPLLASLVPEGLKLSREVAVTGVLQLSSCGIPGLILPCGNTEEHAVKSLELGRVVQNGISWLRGGVHLLQDFIGQSLWDLEERGIATSFTDALQLSIGLER